MQLTMNLKQANAEDILDVSQGMRNGRSKVDIIKRKVGRGRSYSSSYDPISEVIEMLQKDLCYQKRRNDWLEPTFGCLYSIINRMIGKKEISVAVSNDVPKRGGKAVRLVNFHEVRRHLLDKAKWDLKANQTYGAQEKNYFAPGSRQKKSSSLLKRLFIWLSKVL